MMINKRLIGTVSESKKYIVGNVAVQWCSLAANMAMMTSVTAPKPYFISPRSRHSASILLSYVASASFEKKQPGTPSS